MSFQKLVILQKLAINRLSPHFAAPASASIRKSAPSMLPGTAASFATVQILRFLNLPLTVYQKEVKCDHDAKRHQIRADGTYEVLQWGHFGRMNALKNKGKSGAIPVRAPMNLLTAFDEE
jgi:hypothetical protein